MPLDTKPRTHKAWAYQRLGRKSGRLLECGTGYIDRDRDAAHVFMDRHPVIGYTGYVVLLPNNVKPEPPAPEPRRPGEADDEDD